MILFIKQDSTLSLNIARFVFKYFDLKSQEKIYCERLERNTSVEDFNQKLLHFQNEREICKVITYNRLIFICNQYKVNNALFLNKNDSIQEVWDHTQETLTSKLQWEGVSQNFKSTQFEYAPFEISINLQLKNPTYYS